MVSIGDLIVLENGTGGIISSMIKMNDGRYIIIFSAINGKNQSFIQGDIDYYVVQNDHFNEWKKFVRKDNMSKTIL